MSSTTMTSIASKRAELMPIGRLLNTYLTEIRYESVNAFRTAGASVPFLVIPVVVYVLFGLIVVPPEIEEGSRANADLVSYIFTGFATFAVLMPGIFGGVNVAIEREAGLLKLRRALPMPPAASLIAKIATTMIFSAVALTAVLMAAVLAGQTGLSGARMLSLWAVLVAGSVPFCAIGLFIGSIASGSAAPAYGNLVFLPMMWLSGIFIPLPDFLQPWTAIWPAFHLRQLALAAAGIEGFGLFPVSAAAGILVGVTVLFGGLAIRRLARIG